MLNSAQAPAEIALLQRPHEERERITVVQDVTAGKVAKRVGKGGLWMGAAYVGGVAVGPVGVGLALSRPAYKTVRNRLHKRKLKDLRIVNVRQEEAKLLNFPSNHPMERHLYIGNPVRPRDYYPAAAYQRLTLEDKAWEATREDTFPGVPRRLDEEAQRCWLIPVRYLHQFVHQPARTTVNKREHFHRQKRRFAGSFGQ